MQLSFFEVPPVDIALPQTAAAQTAVNGGNNATKPDLDYHITLADPIGSGGQITKVRQNLEIIGLLRRLKEEKRQATPEEQKQLVLYTGWGHTAQPFHPKPKGNWLKLQEEMRPLFTDEEWAAASFSTINAHYTSPEVIRWKWQVIERLGFKGGRILEPALGAGHYFGLMPEAIKTKSQLWGCELDLLTGAVAKQLYPSANIHVGGFETAPYESEFFDLIISNVPFADLRVHDPAIFHAQRGRGHLADVGLHNYYFIKALELARPGGLIAFITSRFTMDSLESKVRAHIAEHALLLGAVRLPVQAFKKNAHTEVTTDIIFLLKHDERVLRGPDWVNTVSKGDYRLNEYYEAHLPMMIGEMKLEGGRYEDAYECVVPKNFDLVAGLNRILALPTLPNDIYLPAVPRPRRQMVVELLTFENPPTDSWIRPGSYAMDDYYRIWQKTKQGWQRADLDGRQLSRVRGLIEVRDAFYRVLKANVDFISAEQLIAAQRELGIVYRRFVARWGYLHEPANRAAFGDDVDSDNILALERWDPFERKAEKAAIFSERLLEPETRPEKADTPMDALIIALRETGGVYLPRMMELTGLREEELIEALQGKIYFDPDANLWVTADDYLSGNIRQKLARAEHMQRLFEEERTNSLPNPYDGNVLALKEVLPRDVGPKDIFVQLGSPWVPQDIYEEFIMDRLFNDYRHTQGSIKPRYIRELGFWRLDLSAAARLRQSSENQQMWGTRRIEGVDLIEKCMNGQQATIYDTWTDDAGRERKMVNQQDTLVARAKQQDIRNAFDKWVWTSEQRTERLVRIYNEKFNSTLPRKFDGTPLHFPGMNPAIVLRQIQRDVIWRGLQSQSLMIAHAVGFGKTYSLTALTMRLRQT
ncbi:MAG: hypothetical protein DPW09_39080, partial [Anaerolineae bacterium]|nr:hypothetical protein [Anaerolineae bacterium]